MTDRAEKLYDVLMSLFYEPRSREAHIAKLREALGEEPEKPQAVCASCGLNYCGDPITAEEMQQVRAFEAKVAPPEPPLKAEAPHYPPAIQLALEEVQRQRDHVIRERDAMLAAMHEAEPCSIDGGSALDYTNEILRKLRYWKEEAKAGATRTVMAKVERTRPKPFVYVDEDAPAPIEPQSPKGFVQKCDICGHDRHDQHCGGYCPCGVRAEPPKPEKAEPIPDSEACLCAQCSAARAARDKWQAAWEKAVESLRAARAEAKEAKEEAEAWRKAQAATSEDALRYKSALATAQKERASLERELADARGEGSK